MLHCNSLLGDEDELLSSPSPNPSPPRPNPKPKEVNNSKSYGTGGDTIITCATLNGSC